MNAKQDLTAFCNYASDSAKTYYQYLDSVGKGVSRHLVSKIKYIAEDVFYIYLQSNIPFREHLKFILKDRDITDNVSIISYDEQKKFLTIRVRGCSVELRASHANDFKIYSDLKFLVKNVATWYKEHNMSNTRKKPPLLPYISFSETPSYEQQNAIETIFNNSVSYIWGAPGTGKTRFVLSNCILRYIKNNKKVLICAPTNNALEQVLYGILDVLKKENIDTNVILRLGIPSDAFLNQYPEVCENKTHVKTLAEFPEKIKALKEHLYNRKCVQAVQCLNDCFLQALLQAHTIHDTINNLQAKNLELDQFIKSNQSEKLRLLATIDRQKSAPRLSLEYLSANNPFSRKNVNKLIVRLQMIEEITSLSSEEIENNNKKIIKLKDEEKFIFDTNSYKMLQLIPDLADIKKQIDALQFNNAYTAALSILPKLRSNAHYKITMRDYCSIPDAEVEAEINKKEQVLHQAQTVTSNAGDNCFILAATLDTYISRVNISSVSDENKLSFKPEHIFLDEAAYAPLIKAATLFYSNQPVTFLGDHMQLPPICEMDKKSIISDYNSVFLWDTNAIYSTLLFNHSLEDIYSCYVNNDFSLMHNSEFLSISNLTNSYRFGTTMANILDLFVYKNGFSGSSDKTMTIKVLNAKGNGNGKRENLAEAEAIRYYLYNTKPSEYVILTPYKAQIKLLQKTLYSITPEDRIMTIHASQGKEFDTVILSIVDYGDNIPWFTSIHNKTSNALNVLNTAISRAKHKLVLVCDVLYWEKKQDELISYLIKIGEKIELKKDVNK